MIKTNFFGTSVSLATEPTLFSADRIDDGTLALLRNLPARIPRSVLDLGCGYGALGVAIATHFIEVRCTLVDRDALAVDLANHNARRANVHFRVRAEGGLDVRTIDPVARFDWVLCNIPARIGDRAIEHFITRGAARLTPTGELRIVVINDLVPVVEKIATRHAPATVVIPADRHTVVAFAPSLSATEMPSLVDIYRYDDVAIGAHTCVRPADISEDASHREEGLPLLFEVLPREPKRTLTWRGGYGPIAVELLSRGAAAVLSDRDLLALEFARENARRAGKAVEILHLPRLRADDVGGPYDTVVIEPSPSDDEGRTRELLEAKRALSGGGRLFALARDRYARSLRDHASVLASRNGWTILSVRGG